MKAFLLAAGLGTRLRPITDNTPKCLVPICGKPMLSWWIELFEKHGITDVLINTHYLRDQVSDFINEHNKSNPKVTLYEAYEPVLIGSGGTILKNRSFIQDDEDFLICYADNLTDTNLSDFINFHKSNDGILSMALFHTNHPKSCGIAETDKNNRIVDFIEKPDRPKSDLANAGMYVTDSKIFEYLWEKELLDLGKDVLPKLIGNMYGWENNSYLIDVGTLDNYKKAQSDWKEMGH